MGLTSDEKQSGGYRRNKCGFDVFLAFIHGRSKASPAVLRFQRRDRFCRFSARAFRYVEPDVAGVQEIKRF